LTAESRDPVTTIAFARPPSSCSTFRRKCSMMTATC